MYAPGPMSAGAIRKKKTVSFWDEVVLTESDRLWESWGWDSINFSNAGVHVFVAKGEVIWRTSSLNLIYSKALELIDIVVSDSWVILARVHVLDVSID